MFRCAPSDPGSLPGISTVGILDFIFPKRCLGCGRTGKYFCDRCRREIRTIETRERATGSLDGLTSFFRYDSLVRQAIKALKYSFVSDLAHEFISLIPQSSFFRLPKYSVLVPIPLHSARLRHRGFNQAELLGNLIAQKLSIPMRTDILVRTQKTTPQVEMKDREKRLKNMHNVFSVSSSTIQQFNNATIFLFDDVFTTGATMRSAATALKRNGVGFVLGITMAR